MYMVHCLLLMAAGWADKELPMKCTQRGLLCLLLTGLSFQLSAQEVVLKLENKLSEVRKNELIVLSRSFVEQKMGLGVGLNELEIFIGDEQQTLQFDDLNQDGEWDELVFLAGFKSAESLNLKMKLNRTDRDIISGVTAHVRHKRKLENNKFGPSLKVDSIPAGQPNTDFNKEPLPPFLTEGPAWENDKVGFRIYMDVRNTKDIWGKTTTGMKMDQVGVDPKVIYHHLAPWGMDILAVGKSLGAGSLAMRVPIKGKADTLVRLGGLNMGKVIYRQLADGPVRAVFQLAYPEWNVMGNGRLTSLTEQISIWGGQYFYESKIALSNAPEGAELVTGIVNMKSSKSMKDSYDKAMVLSTFDKQSENADQLGMAVLLDKSDWIAFGQTPDAGSEVMQTYTVAIETPAAGARSTFRFYACWEKSDAQFSKENGFKKYLGAEAAKYNSPIAIR